VETPRIANEEEIQDSIVHGKVDANLFFLGIKRAYTRRLPGKGVRNLKMCYGESADNFLLSYIINNLEYF
jgi:hypothetical protein